jgi:hypothetical protein
MFFFKNNGDEAFNTEKNHSNKAMMHLRLQYLKIEAMKRLTLLFPTRLHVHQRMNANGTSTK